MPPSRHWIPHIVRRVSTGVNSAYGLDGRLVAPVERPTGVYVHVCYTARMGRGQGATGVHNYNNAGLAPILPEKNNVTSPEKWVI